MSAKNASEPGASATVRTAASSLGSLKEADAAPAPWALPSLGRAARAAALLALAAGSAALAAAGGGVLFWLLASRALAPAALVHRAPLPLDLANSDLSAYASFLPPGGGGGRFLAPGEEVDVWVDLTLPPAGAGGLAHVVGELQDAAGARAARAALPAQLRPARRGAARALVAAAAAPLRWAGLLRGAGGGVASVLLFPQHRERADVPFAALALEVKSHGGGVPGVLAAEARVELRVGLLRRLAHAVRPRPLLAAALGLAALAAAAGGGFTAAACLAALALGALRGTAAAEAAAAADLSELSATSDGDGADAESGSFEGFEIQEEEEEEEIGAEEEEPAAAAPPADGWFGRVAKGARRPLDDVDTAYMAGGSRDASGSGGGAVRYRGGRT
jgi:hypothetical protein